MLGIVHCNFPKCFETLNIGHNHPEIRINVHPLTIVCRAANVLNAHFEKGSMCLQLFYGRIMKDNEIPVYMQLRQ